MTDAQNQLAIWRTDPIAFINDFCRNPETGRPFELYPAQERFLREALTLTPDGRLPYSELLFSAPKKIRQDRARRDGSALRHPRAGRTVCRRILPVQRLRAERRAASFSR